MTAQTALESEIDAMLNADRAEWQQLSEEVSVLRKCRPARSSC